MLINGITCYFLFIFLLKISSSNTKIKPLNVVNDFRRNISTYNGTFPIKVYIPKAMNVKEIWSYLDIFNNKTLMGLSYSNVTVNKTIGFNFRRGNNCTAPIGKSKKSGITHEYITLTEECEKQKGTVQQLTAKMLGMINTNNRPDRDNYIYVNVSNIKKGRKGLFNRYNWSQVPLYINVSYDYGSALHYSNNYMSKNNESVLKSKHQDFHSSNLDDYYNKMLGQQYELSFNDLKIINKLYSGDNSYYENTTCYNDGYIRPYYRNCLCPNGFTGWSCNETEPNTEGCKQNNTLEAKEEIQKLKMSGKENCTYLISSKPGRRIQIILASVKTKEKIPCYQKMGLEVKYVKDKGATGLCLCGRYRNINIISEDNKVMIQYTGLEDDNKGYITYKVYPKYIPEESEESNFVH
uniref:Metalloendopeptidase n=1 Tax=Parastrongyloides trichosuri TaxID=131310 RepID=A0A0N4Z8G0_PARTI